VVSCGVNFLATNPTNPTQSVVKVISTWLLVAANPREITELLLSWSKGSSAALEDLVPLIYPELRRLARAYMRREDPAHTLQTSALINEAYLRLVDQRSVAWQDRAHFFAVAAQVMRHILIDHARRHQSAKRGAGAFHVALNEAEMLSENKAAEFVALDDALTKLAKIDERKSQIVELRFFGGLTVEEVADLLSLSPITIKREWRSARAWLQREISDREHEQSQD
jgi:RNA polymerase sigma factor (TIGR02999 family)